MLIVLAKSQSVREHLTSHLLWVAAWILVTLVFPVFLVDELVLVFFASL